MRGRGGRDASFMTGHSAKPPPSPLRPILPVYPERQREYVHPRLASLSRYGEREGGVVMSVGKRVCMYTYAGEECSNNVSSVNIFASCSI